MKLSERLGMLAAGLENMRSPRNGGIYITKRSAASNILKELWELRAIARDIERGMPPPEEPKKDG